MPQITIFKQVCGTECVFRVLETAYGLERLVCALSGLGFSHHDLNCLCAFDSFRAFCVLERALLRSFSEGVFCICERHVFKLSLFV